MKPGSRGVVALFGLQLTACSGSTATTSAAAALEPARTPVALDLTYARPAIVGAEVQAAASGLPAGKTVDLRWGTVTGGWVIEDYYRFRGKKYSETTSSFGIERAQSPGGSSGPRSEPAAHFAGSAGGNPSPSSCTPQATGTASA